MYPHILSPVSRALYNDVLRDCIYNITLAHRLLDSLVV